VHLNLPELNSFQISTLSKLYIVPSHK